MATKRANGEGSIRKKNVKGKIYWEGRYTDEQGKQRSVSGKTQSEVRDKLKEAERRVQKEKEEQEARKEGRKYYDKNMTLNEWYDIYKTLFTKKLKPQTIAGQEGDYNRHFKEILGEMRMRYISEEDVLYVQEIMINNGLAHNTIVTHFEILNKLFNKAIDKQIITNNPVKNLKLKIEEPENPKRALTREEIDCFFEVLNQTYPYLTPLFVFLQNTGCRIGEAISIEWQDISSDMQFCLINKTTTRYYDVSNKRSTTSEGSIKTNSKHNKAGRKIPLNSEVQQMLSSLKCKRQEEGMYAATTKVFLSKRKKKLYSSYVNEQLKIISEIIQREHISAFPTLSSHWFRHTFASYGVEKNIPTIYLQRICGWASPVMLSKIYAHMNDMQALDAVQNIYN